MAVKLEEIDRQRQGWPPRTGWTWWILSSLAREGAHPARLLEKNAEGARKLKAAIEAGRRGPCRNGWQEGTLSVEQLSGVTHEDCAAFSRDFGVLLDVEDLVPGAEYTLEASSPGLDRKLSRPEDFERFAGSLVKVQTFEPIRNNRHWQGRLTASTGAGNHHARPERGQAEQQEPEGRRQHGGDCARNIEKAQLVPEI
jgi:ribosome maturation factor RimP